MGNDASKPKGHTLGGGSSGSVSKSNSGSNGPSSPKIGSEASPKKNPFVQPKAKPANTEQDRDARLAAVEARLNAQEKRGVQKGGGKLAEKLEESKRTQGQSDTAPVVRNDDVAEMWKN
ncbi:hypothetical protein BCR33DRAFT_714900 [Rhizoclosmatium globosum]|uniref:Uncharacterized protein n=1 Tax=Rhizoclosmatium globosum TaxID=329046 RepID=A0A1Y2CNC6_9FUNG|nr:hypothetical protein BCR33DRAFT_714900 [Rhizoclosmatium globosum]|eukprot:ORY47845.1 hypothetical protein BCR33DRAFT_714900 [Rhizoclosmatium globosum]